MMHTYSITCPSFLCAPDDQVGLDGIAGLLQEAAWQHARKLGVAFTEEERDVFWALHRLGIRIYHRPRWGEPITVTTWPSRIIRLYAMREYAIHNDAGELLVEASSAWLVLRTKDSRPVPPIRYFPDGDLDADYAVEIPLGRLPSIGVEEVARKLAGAQWHPVRPSDTDRNAHVNNIRYAQWYADGTPELLEPVLNDGQGGSGAPVPPTVLLSFTAETRIGQEYAVISDGAAEIHVRDPGESPDKARCACRLQLLNSA